MKDNVHPYPSKEIISARYFKDNPKFRKEVIKLLESEKERTAPPGNGLMPKHQKMLYESNPNLWTNGYMARGVEGLSQYSQTFRRIKLEHPTITKEYYKEKRKKYLLDEK